MARVKYKKPHMTILRGLGRRSHKSLSSQLTTKSLKPRAKIHLRTGKLLRERKESR
jgi:hypothetical protein